MPALLRVPVPPLRLPGSSSPVFHPPPRTPGPGNRTPTSPARGPPRGGKIYSSPPRVAPPRTPTNTTVVAPRTPTTAASTDRSSTRHRLSEEEQFNRTPWPGPGNRTPGSSSPSRGRGGKIYFSPPRTPTTAARSTNTPPRSTNNYYTPDTVVAPRTPTAAASTDRSTRHRHRLSEEEKFFQQNDTGEDHGRRGIPTDVLLENELSSLEMNHVRRGRVFSSLERELFLSSNDSLSPRSSSPISEKGAPSSPSRKSDCSVDSKSHCSKGRASAVVDSNAIDQLVHVLRALPPDFPRLLELAETAALEYRFLEGDAAALREENEVLLKNRMEEGRRRHRSTTSKNQNPHVAEGIRSYLTHGGETPPLPPMGGKKISPDAWAPPSPRRTHFPVRLGEGGARRAGVPGRRAADELSSVSQSSTAQQADLRLHATSVLVPKRTQETVFPSTDRSSPSVGTKTPPAPRVINSRTISNLSSRSDAARAADDHHAPTARPRNSIASASSPQRSSSQRSPSVEKMPMHSPIRMVGVANPRAARGAAVQNRRSRARTGRAEVWSGWSGWCRGEENVSATRERSTRGRSRSCAGVLAATGGAPEPRSIQGTFARRGIHDCVSLSAWRFLRLNGNIPQHQTEMEGGVEASESGVACHERVGGGCGRAPVAASSEMSSTELHKLRFSDLRVAPSRTVDVENSIFGFARRTDSDGGRGELDFRICASHRLGRWTWRTLI